MKINQEDFDKLKQLDRIEYRQVEERLKERYKGGNFFFVIFLLIPLFMFYSLFMLVAYGSLGKQVFYSLADRLPWLLYVAFLGMLLTAVIDLYLSIKLKQELEILQKKYFNLTIK